MIVSIWFTIIQSSIPYLHYGKPTGLTNFTFFKKMWPLTNSDNNNVNQHLNVIIYLWITRIPYIKVVIKAMYKAHNGSLHITSL